LTTRNLPKEMKRHKALYKTWEQMTKWGLLVVVQEEGWGSESKKKKSQTWHEEISKQKAGEREAFVRDTEKAQTNSPLRKRGFNQQTRRDFEMDKRGGQ